MKINEFVKNADDEVTLKISKQDILVLQRALFALSVRQKEDASGRMMSEPDQEQLLWFANLFGRICEAPRTPDAKGQ